MTADQVPRRLRFWFVIHFVVDMVFAIPLLLVPERLLRLLAWPGVDPVTSRLVGAALLAIGVSSWLERNANRDVFRSMLNLKIVWASGAVVGIGLALLRGGPPIAWAVLLIFVAFLAVWSYFRVVLR